MIGDFSFFRIAGLEMRKFRVLKQFPGSLGYYGDAVCKLEYGFIYVSLMLLINVYAFKGSKSFPER